MGVVTIRCPNTGRDVTTGIETDEANFQLFPDVLSRSHCPMCGLDHSWWKREARLLDFSSPAIAACH
jgi:hypothetical protein